MNVFRYHLHITFIPLLVASVALAASESDRDWSLSIGAGAAIAPKYPGSDSLSVTPVPLIEARWHVAVLDTGRLGPPFIGVRLPVVEHELTVYAGAALLFDRKGDDTPVPGQPDIDQSLGAFAATEWTPGASWMLVRALGTSDLLNERHGSLIQLQTMLRAPPQPHLRIQVGVGAVWLDHRAMDGWFGTVGFAPQAGLREVHAVMETFIPLTGKWSLTGRIIAAKFIGDAADSPLTERLFQLRTVGGIVYTF